MKIELFVCYHAQSPQISSDILKPLSVYHAVGDNIASKGDAYSELRSLYWIWKNVRADIVGLFHYRRFLNLNTSVTQITEIQDDFIDKYGLNTKRISELMQRYDVILPCLTPQHVKNDTPTTYDFYAKHHFHEDMDISLSLIAQKYPQMATMATDVIKNQKQSYRANLIIAKKAFFDEYAAWLFDILFNVEKEIAPSVLHRVSYQQRVYGFLAERLLKIFINYKQQTENLKVCEAPLLYVETNYTKHRHYLWRQFKRHILTCIGLGRKEWTYYVK